MAQFGFHIMPLEFSRERDLAQAAEALGYYAVYAGDHFYFEIAGQRLPVEPAYEGMSHLAAICGATSKIRIGHLVVNNLLRPPAITAQALATLDQLSGGRLIAGIGTGWTEKEFRMSGIPFPDMKTRVEMLDESLACMLSLWTNDFTTFAGKHYRFDECVLWPKPAQKPHPPILIGGGGRPLQRIAAKYGSVSNITWELGRAGHFSGDHLGEFDEASYRARIDYLREQTEKQGRPRDAVQVANLLTAVVITDSNAATRKTAEGIGKALAFSAEQVLRSPMILVGTPEECVTELQRRVRTFDIGQFIFGTRSEQTLRTLAEKVIPFVV